MTPPTEATGVKTSGERREARQVVALWVSCERRELPHPFGQVGLCGVTTSGSRAGGWRRAVGRKRTGERAAGVRRGRSGERADFECGSGVNEEWYVLS